MTMTRRAVASDQAAIGRLAEAAGLFPADALPAMIAPALNGEAPDLWIMAERDGAAAGFAFAEPEKFTDRTWNLRAIGTDPAWRACGVGSTLLAAVEAQLAGIGARLLIIETTDADDQIAVRGFYQARGCTQIAVLPDFWEDGVAKLIFAKRIAAAG